MEELLLIVNQQEELPQVGKVLEVEKLISGKVCGFKVKKILGLKWNKSNNLVVTVSGNYIYME